MLQYATICYNMLQYATIFYNILQYPTIFYRIVYNILKYPTIFYNILQYSTICYNILQYSTIFYNILPATIATITDMMINCFNIFLTYFVNGLLLPHHYYLYAVSLSNSVVNRHIITNIMSYILKYKQYIIA